MAHPVDTAVLDFDGVIARSIEQHAEGYKRVLAPLGVDIEPRDIFLREGARSESIIQDLLERAGIDPEPTLVERLGDEKQEAFLGLGVPQLYGGARAMVSSIRSAAKHLGLVTGTRFSNLETMIPDLLQSFDVVLAQDAYQNDKPHPEPYRTAAERLGVASADCVGLENAIRGVQSAKAAGYGRVIGIATTMAAEELLEAGADEVAFDHEDAARRVVAALGKD